jgi:hypothetical protein
MTTNRRKYIRLLVLLIWFGILFTWILSLSQVSMDSGLQIYGSRDHVTNQHSVIRVVGIDTKVKSPIPIQSPEHRWRNGEQLTEWKPLKFTQRVAWQAGVTAPATEAIWTLEVRANVRGERVIAATQLNVMKQQLPLDTIAFKPASEIDWDTDQETAHVNITPLDGSVLRGFQNTLVLTTTQIGPPPRVSYLDARHMNQMVSLTPADVQGVYTFDISPAVGELVFKVETAGATGTIQLSTKLAYYRIEAVPVQTGDLRFSVQSRDRDKNIMIDLWQSQYWLQTRRLPGEQAVNATQFSTQSHGPSPFWVQAYNNPLNPIQARGGQFILTNETEKRVLAAWLKTNESLRFASLQQSTLYPRFVRGQLSPPISKPLLIADSSIHQAPELMVEKQKWMKIVAWLLALSTFALIAAVLIQIKRHRAELRSRFMDMDSDDELSEDQERLESSMRDGIVMLLFIAILVAGVTWLFINARW